MGQIRTVCRKNESFPNFCAHFSSKKKSVELSTVSQSCERLIRVSFLLGESGGTKVKLIVTRGQRRCRCKRGCLKTKRLRSLFSLKNHLLFIQFLIFSYEKLADAREFFHPADPHLVDCPTCKFRELAYIVKTAWGRISLLFLCRVKDPYSLSTRSTF